MIFPKISASVESMQSNLALGRGVKGREMDLNALYDINQNGFRSHSIRELQNLQSLPPKHDFKSELQILRITIVLRGLCRKNTYLKNIA